MDPLGWTRELRLSICGIQHWKKVLQGQSWRGHHVSWLSQCFSRVKIFAQLSCLLCCPKRSSLLECRGPQQERRQGWKKWQCEWYSVSGVGRHKRHQRLPAYFFRFPVEVLIWCFQSRSVVSFNPRYQKGSSEAMNWAFCCYTFVLHLYYATWRYEQTSIPMYTAMELPHIALYADPYKRRRAILQTCRHVKAGVWGCVRGTVYAVPCLRSCLQDFLLPTAPTLTPMAPLKPEN